jgi:hypothetical protein
LASLENLRELDLSENSEITDAGLMHLAALKHLKTVDVWCCHKVSDEGIAALRKALPECEIRRHP